jgi:hypothetical protein
MDEERRRTGAEDSPEADNPEVDHEHSDVAVRPILTFVIWLSLVVIVVFVVLWGTFGYFERREARLSPAPHPLAAVEPPPAAAPSPVLQVDPAGDLKRMQEEETAILTGYGWVDPQAGVVYIPIDQAIRLIAERGLPARQEPARTEELPRGSASGRQLRPGPDQQ